MICVLGASGQVGRPLVESLCATGTPLRAMVRTERSAATIRRPGVDVVLGDLTDPGSLPAVLDGVSRLFLLTPGAPDQTAVQDAVVRAAVQARVQAIVKLSVYTAAPDSPCSLSRWHWANDRTVAESGLAYTILHPHTFMQSVALQFAHEIRTTGTMSAAVDPTATLTMVDSRDLSEVAAAVLREGEHHGRTLLVTGPDALSYADCAAQLSERLGRTVRYRQISPEQATAGFRAGGLPEWLADALVDLHRMYDTGTLNPLSDVTRRLTGQPPRSFGDFLDDHIDAFA